MGQMAPPVSAVGLNPIGVVMGPPGAVMGPPQGVAAGGGGSARRGSLTKESIARHNKK